jgi:hypothetical protein
MPNLKINSTTLTDRLRDSLLSKRSLPNLLPVSEIINSDAVSNDTLNLSKEKLLFCYEAMVRTIEAIQNGKYTDFDAHTVSNCCHGMSLFTITTLFSVLHFDMDALLKEGIEKINNPCEWKVPAPLIDLAKLYLLAFIKEVDPQKGTRTSIKKLKTISPLGTQFSNLLMKRMQRHFSNLVAYSYSSYLNEINAKMPMNSIPIGTWGKYIQPDHLRKDQRGILYASNLFSMQVALGQLIHSKSKIAVVTDLIDSQGKIKGRYARFLQGDGNAQMKQLSSEEVEELYSHKNEPIVVFGASTYSDTLDLAKLKLRLKPWISHFTSLVLACDVFYPQFPSIKDDPEFDRSPIIPEEESVQNVISKLSETKGVSSADPSLFCLAHIFQASIGQVLQVNDCEDVDALPYSFIPENKLTSLTEEAMNTSYSVSVIDF